jgi:hypothetical protein
MCRCAENNTGCNNILPGWIASKLESWKEVSLSILSCNISRYPFNRGQLQLPQFLAWSRSLVLPFDLWRLDFFASTVILPSVCLSACLSACGQREYFKNMYRTNSYFVRSWFGNTVRTQMPRICEVGRSGNPRYKFRFLKIFQRNLNEVLVQNKTTENWSSSTRVLVVQKGNREKSST